MKECFKEDRRVFQGSFKVASRGFQWYFKGTQRVSQGSLKGIEESFWDISRLIQDNCKEV